MAYSLCLERRPAALKDRRKEPNQACPRWAEAGAEMLQALCHSPPCRKELLATQLSDALELASSPSVAPAAAARQLTQALLLDTKGTVDALPLGGCAIWAPADSFYLGRILSGLIQHAAENRSPRSLRLLVAVEAFPGCSQKDLRSHAVLLEKLRGIVNRALTGGRTRPRAEAPQRPRTASP